MTFKIGSLFKLTLLIVLAILGEITAVMSKGRKIVVNLSRIDKVSHSKTFGRLSCCLLQSLQHLLQQLQVQSAEFNWSLGYSTGSFRLGHILNQLRTQLNSWVLPFVFQFWIPELEFDQENLKQLFSSWTQPSN